MILIVVLCVFHRVWDPSSLSTSATVELKSSLLSLDWVPQYDNLILIGSGDSIVKLFETTTLRDHWEVKSDPKLPKYENIYLIFTKLYCLYTSSLALL